MNASLIIYFIFIHASLLLPGYVLIKKTKLLKQNPGIELCFGYLITIAILAILATAQYIFKLDRDFSIITSWILFIGCAIEFFKARYLKDLFKLRFPLICLVFMSVLSLLFIGLSFSSKYTIVPDPSPEPARNYKVLDVKVINVAQTPADDNYIPYRQAQFLANRSDLKTCFICGWGVTFFQRTPLMGALTASYFNLLNDKPPVNYIWSSTANDPNLTFAKFQIIASILNMLFVIPAFFILTKLFNKKTAIMSCLFFVTSQFFIYNASFSWPKSFVAFFILLSWLLILEKHMKYTLLAGVASGVAYLTHDLSILYIGTGVLLLLYNKRFKETFAFGATTTMFAIPWLYLSSLVYQQPSSFIYYPISLNGIPRLDQKRQMIHQFLHTSPLQLLAVRIKNLIYLMTPYELLTSEGGQAGFKRLWAVGLYSVPGAVGLGIMIPTVIAAFKRLGDLTFWILALTPVVLSTVVIGWPKGLGALHFAEASVVLFVGLGVAYLVKLKKQVWLLLACLVNTAQFIYFVVFSYSFHIAGWFTNLRDVLSLTFMIITVIVCAWLIYRANTDKKIWIA